MKESRTLETFVKFLFPAPFQNGKKIGGKPESILRSRECFLEDGAGLTRTTGKVRKNDDNVKLGIKKVKM